MKRAFATGLVLAGLRALSGCGDPAGVDDGGAFATRMTDICIKERGEVDRAACECVSRAIHESLSGQDRKLAMLSLDAEEGLFKTQEEARNAMQAAGFDPADAQEVLSGFIDRMTVVEGKASSRCNLR